MLIVYIIGFCYKDSTDDQFHNQLHKKLFLPGIIIDLYQIYNIFSKIKPDKLIVITDIEENVTIEIVLEAIRESKIDAHILSFITKLKEQNSYLQFVSKTQLLTHFQENLINYDKVFVYYTGHVESGSLLLPVYSKSSIIKRKILKDSTIQSSLVNIPLPSDMVTNNLEKEELIINTGKEEDIVTDKTKINEVNTQDFQVEKPSIYSTLGNNIFSGRFHPNTSNESTIEVNNIEKNNIPLKMNKDPVSSTDVNFPFFPTISPIKTVDEVLYKESIDNKESNINFSPLYTKFHSDNDNSRLIFTTKGINVHINNNTFSDSCTSNELLNTNNRLIFTTKGINDSINNNTFSDSCTSNELLDTIVNFTPEKAEIMIIMDCCMSDGLNLPYVLKDGIYKRNPNGNIEYGYNTHKKILLITSTLPNQNSIATNKGSIFTGILCRNILHGKKSLINLISAVQSETKETYKQTPTIYVNNPLIKTLLHFLFPGEQFKVNWNPNINAIELKYLS